MSFGEYLDLNKYLENEDTYHKALAVMYRPITVKQNDLYDIEKYEGSDKYAEIMQDSPYGVFQGTTVFFWLLECRWI